jgi:uncharacterized protein YkwD
MTHLIAPFLCLIMMLHRPVSAAFTVANFQQEALLQHNYRRQRHCSPALVLNTTLNTMAQSHANTMAANNGFSFSNAAGIGQNIFKTSSSVAITYVNGKHAFYAVALY